MVLFYLLLTPCLPLWYFTTFYWLPAYTFGTLLSSTVPLRIPMVLYYLLLAHCLSRVFTIPIVPYYLLMAPCLSLWFSFIHLLTHCLYLWYFFTFYWLPANPYGTILPSIGSLPIPMVLYYLLLAPCLYRWYSTIFYCPTTNTFGTLLSSTGSLPIPHFLSFWFEQVGSLPIPLVLYYLLLSHYQYLWYSTIFYWLTAYPAFF